MLSAISAGTVAGGIFTSNALSRRVAGERMKARFLIHGNFPALFRTAVALLPVLMLLVGCQTATIESRRAQRATAYAALLPEQQQLVDKGEIKSGLTEDAVYIAWGPASEILRGETDGKSTTTWIYRGTWWDEQTHWTYRTTRQGGRFYEFPVLDHTSVPRSYVSAEVVFVDGIVKSWRARPRPYF